MSIWCRGLMVQGSAPRAPLAPTPSRHQISRHLSVSSLRSAPLLSRPRPPRPAAPPATPTHRLLPRLTLLLLLVRLSTPGPSWGYSQSQFIFGLSTFGDISPQINEEMASRTRTGYPHEGPCVAFSASRPSVASVRFIWASPPPSFASESITSCSSAASSRFA